MNEIKIQQNFSSFSVASVKNSAKNVSTDFKSMLSDKIFEVPDDFDKYKCGIIFGENMHFSFPPDDAPAYFKKAWYEVTSKLDSEERICIFNDDVRTAIKNGFYYDMDYEFHRDRLDGDYYYNTMNARVKNLGVVGCLELAIRSTEQGYKDNVAGGNEKKWTDKMKRSLDALNEIMEKCKESGDPTINRQIQLADADFYKSRQQVWRDAAIWLQENGGDDIATMSDEKFDALMKRIVPTFTKYLPDGTIITMNAETNKILDISKQRNFDLLQAI